MQPPRNVSEMKSLLGMTQYVSRFIPNYASTTAPLRALTHQKVSWKWQIKHYHLYLYGAKFTVITDHKPLQKSETNVGTDRQLEAETDALRQRNSVQAR